MEIVFGKDRTRCCVSATIDPIDKDQDKSTGNASICLESVDLCMTYTQLYNWQFCTMIVLDSESAVELLSKFQLMGSDTLGSIVHLVFLRFVGEVVYNFCA